MRKSTLESSGGRRLVLALGVLAAALAIVVHARATDAADAPQGGIFKISLAVQAGLDSMDPALSFTAAGWALLDTTCLRLMSYPDRPPPAGFRLVPEAATSVPRLSRDLKTVTFTIRSGFRFSDGRAVHASAFARAINRTLAPAVRSPGAMFTRDIVGAADVLAGKRTSASGLVARGNTLVVRFTRPAPDFAALTALPYFCAVPPTLPADPEGLALFPSAGPYHVVDYRPGERVVLRRNPFYGGTRPHHVDGFDVDLQAPSPTEMVARVDRGDADWGLSLAPVFLDSPLDLEHRYGIKGPRFFVRPGLTLRMLAFNTSRPLFRDNSKLRQAVNFALDRRAIQAVGGGPLAGQLTDQYLPSLVPGFRDADIYPLDSPNLARARELAQGNLRSGKVVLYTTDFVQPLAVAQLAKQQLAEIGLQVEIKAFPVHIQKAEYLNQLVASDEPWDMALVVWYPNLPDSLAYINLLLDGRNIGVSNVAHFASSSFDAEMRRAAATLEATKRQEAYGALDVRLARDAAPLAALSVLSEATFVSKRVGCIVLRPQLDLVAACLR
jgi:peptide/nickel transport system substrate-binding protein